MASDGTFSSRHNLPTPGDGHPGNANPYDDATQAVSISDPDNWNWIDILQTLLLDDSYFDGKLVSAGNLSSRPAAASSAPKLYVVTDGGESGDQPYLTYNDDSEWHIVADKRRVDYTDTDSPHDLSYGETAWIDASSGAVQGNLPTPDDGGSLRIVIVDASNTVTIARDGTETIDGIASDLSLDEIGVLELEADGTNWRSTIIEPEALKDGGRFEIDVAELAGGNGSVNQVVITDGSALSYGFVGPANVSDDVLVRQANIPLAEIADGNNAVGLQMHVPSGKTLKIWEMGVQDDSESAPASLDVVVRDLTNTTDIASEGSKHNEGSPIASKSGAIDVQFRVENATGGSVNASGYVLYSME